MLDLQHTSVQLFQAEDSCDKDELTRRIQSATEREEELLIHPKFFSALRSLEPRIQSISLRLKPGRAHNEMTCFRYDVVIEIDRDPTNAQARAAFDANLLVIDATHGAQPTQQGGRFVGWQLKLAEWGVDRQIERPVPATYAEMLRRSQPRIQLLLMVAIMAVVLVGMMAIIPMVVTRSTGKSLPPLSQFLPGVIAAFAWQACVMTLAQTTAMWGQRRGSLVIDFLSPVSRAGYWRGLREAIARDLILPAVLGAACLALAIGLSVKVEWWAWGVAAMGEPSCCVSYYGSGVPSMIGMIERVHCPTLFHFGDSDAYIPNDGVEAVAAAIADRDGFVVNVEHAGHAFDNHESEMFWNEAAAKSAWAKTMSFLEAARG
jgi:hypothetical protein